MLSRRSFLRMTAGAAVAGALPLPSSVLSSSSLGFAIEDETICAAAVSPVMYTAELASACFNDNLLTESFDALLTLVAAEEESTTIEDFQDFPASSLYQSLPEPSTNSSLLGSPAETTENT
jgi:hypothetical protein